VGPLPQQVGNLTPGAHTLVFQGSDRFAPERKEVTLAADETLHLDNVALRPIRGRASFDVRNPDVSLVLVSGDRKIAVADRSDATELDLDRDWTLEASRDGFRDVRMLLDFGGKADATFVVSVDEPVKAPSAQPAANSPVPAPPAAVQTTAPSNDGSPAGAKTVTISTPRAEGATASGAPCSLNLNSIPASKVVLDGRPLGDTPKIGINVQPGRHTVVFVGDSGRKTASATCTGGEKKTVAVQFR
jgi:hypothetical protein